MTNPRDPVPSDPMTGARPRGAGSLPAVPLLLLCLATSTACQEVEIAEADILPAFEAGAAYDPSALPNDFEVEEHRFERDDGTEIFGVSLERSPSAPGLVYFGGNLQSVDRSLETVARDLEGYGLNLYLFDRRGQGRSGGVPRAARAVDDARAVFDYARTLTDRPLIVHGFSLGGFEAVAVAEERDVAGLVLEATATNVEDFAAAVVPWYARPFVRLSIDDELRVMDNAESLARQTDPLLLLAGGEDEQTPPMMMRALYDASASETRFFARVEHAGHQGIVRHAQAREAYCRFLDAVGHGDCR